jgi:hypothetical protein
MFDNKDVSLLKQRGIDVNEAEKQIERLKTGTKYVKLLAPAIANDGIVVPDEDTLKEWVSIYETERDNFDLIKFVPASGAASRMFKRIQEVLSMEPSPNIEDLLADKDFYSVGNTINSIDKFAFAKDLAKCLNINSDKPSQYLKIGNYKDMLNSMISDEGLGLANLPKGLIAFHKYGKKIRTSFEEHIIEGEGYINSGNNTLNLHFTVSPEHRKGFENLLDKIIKDYEKLLNIKLNVEFSEQKPSTDTLALDANGQAFRNTDGLLLFRPGGHGSLIENMNSLNYDIVFVKNIDNVVPQAIIDQTIKHKKALGGLLLSVRKTIHEFLHLCEEPDVSEDTINAMAIFAHNELHLEDISNISNYKSKIEKLKEILNRPIRICGMVKNTGEPGGGPFWVENQFGKPSLQIIEKAQIELSKPEQKSIFEKSTHFNPVDLVCSITDYKGQAFDLKKFRDDNTYFVAEKTKGGRELKALELPGLWNGAMAEWITLFVEVPLATFNPVKEINDLLRHEHQATD